MCARKKIGPERGPFVSGFCGGGTALVRVAFTSISSDHGFIYVCAILNHSGHTLNQWSELRIFSTIQISELSSDSTGVRVVRYGFAAALFGACWDVKARFQLHELIRKVSSSANESPDCKSVYCILSTRSVILLNE